MRKLSRGIAYDQVSNDELSEPYGRAGSGILLKHLTTSV